MGTDKPVPVSNPKRPFLVAHARWSRRVLPINPGLLAPPIRPGFLHAYHFCVGYERARDHRARLPSQTTCAHWTTTLVGLQAPKGTQGPHSTSSCSTGTHTSRCCVCPKRKNYVSSPLQVPYDAHKVMTLCASCTIPPAERMPCLHKKAGGLGCCSTGHEGSRHDARARLRAV